MKVPLIGINIDERFLIHRLRASSTAGIAGAALASLLLGWHFYVDSFWSWDLFAVVVAFLLIKWSLMAWYRFTD